MVLAAEYAKQQGLFSEANSALMKANSERARQQLTFPLKPGIVCCFASATGTIL